MSSRGSRWTTKKAPQRLVPKRNTPLLTERLRRLPAGRNPWC